MAELKALTEKEVEDMLLETGAIMEGHFLLTSGLHSPRYVEKFNVLQKPEYTEKLCQAMAAKLVDANIEILGCFFQCQQCLIGYCHVFNVFVFHNRTPLLIDFAD